MQILTRVRLKPYCTAACDTRDSSIAWHIPGSPHPFELICSLRPHQSTLSTFLDTSSLTSISHPHPAVLSQHAERISTRQLPLVVVARTRLLAYDEVDGLRFHASDAAYTAPRAELLQVLVQHLLDFNSQLHVITLLHLFPGVAVRIRNDGAETSHHSGQRTTPTPADPHTYISTFSTTSTEMDVNKVCRTTR